MLESDRGTLSPEPKQIVRLFSERDRNLEASDFPNLVLSDNQKRALSGTHLDYVVLDNNKSELADVQIDLMRTWEDSLGESSIFYATNGGTQLPVKADRNVTIFNRPSLPNHLGVPDLVAEATKSILSLKNDKLEKRWITFASADVWILNSNRWLAYLADAVQQSDLVVSSYCGGLGRTGVAMFPEYYLINPTVFKNTYPATGLMTEFFAIRADLAARSLVYWNDPTKGRFCYKTFHQDARTQRFIRRGQGTVEAHFRFLLAQTMGKEFSSRVMLMNPSPPDLTKYPRVYPCGVGYTSTHDDSIRAENVRIAMGYGFDLNSVPSMEQWLLRH